VATSSLAEDLSVTPPAVTDMLHHLESQGLINYKPNKGITLTGLGTEKALKVIRRHRLWERFLTDVMGLKWDKVHEEACRLEHVTSPEVEKGLTDILGHVDTCPHGHAIPDEDGNVRAEQILELSKLGLNRKAYMVAVAKEDPRLLKKLEKLGLRPGTLLTIMKKNKGGSLEAEVNGERVSLSSEMADVILAKPAAAAELSGIEEMPLSRLEAGQSGVVKSYDGKRGMLGRCLSLGFTPGSPVKMVENYRRGPVLVKVCDTEVALGREVAEKISVTRDTGGC
jgi:DtxR family Mn-dependent transcriptional regulator